MFSYTYIYSETCIVIIIIFINPTLNGIYNIRIIYIIHNIQEVTLSDYGVSHIYTIYVTVHHKMVRLERMSD